MTFFPTRFSWSFLALHSAVLLQCANAPCKRHANHASLVLLAQPRSLGVRHDCFQAVLESELKQFTRVVLLRTSHIHSWISNLAHPKSQCQMLKHSHKQISEARFGAPSSASLAWLWWLPDERTNIPCELHVVAVLTCHVRCASPSGTGRSGPRKHGCHHIWKKELLRECDFSVPMGPMNKGLTNWSNISRGIAWWMGNLCLPPKKSSGIDFRKHFSFLTTIHDTAWNTFVADVQVLRSRLGCRDLGKNWTTCYLNLKQRHLCNLQILRWLTRQAKLPLLRGLHGTWNKSHWPWNVKSTIRKAELPLHNTAGSPLG